MRKLLFAPHVVEKAAHAAVVEPFCKTLPAALAQRVESSGLALAAAEFGQLIERIGPVMPIHEIEVRVSGVIGDRAPVLRVSHAVDDRAISARRLSEAAAMLAASERPKLAIDKGNDLAREIVRVISGRGGVDVLI